MDGDGFISAAEWLQVRSTSDAGLIFEAAGGDLLSVGLDGDGPIDLEELRDEYFGARPGKTVVRFVEVASRIAAARSAWGSEGRPPAERGATMRAELAALGPVFVKVAQTLATRSDIVDQELGRELGLMQDALGTFDNAVALATVREEFADWPGPVVAEGSARGAAAQGARPLFAELSAEPVAAASLAQVYRGALDDGTDVAVKVQRPGLLEQVGPRPPAPTP
ncbi:unnamed protein product [Prorocentrum cordatum]|uniref:ABC1 atypical kinase-like domain-containing protein n=1 Tax=Prorocentrum cordatum TaxID=2364126 RepID=A0ABN9QCR7_9DINO|nr:unnamed protein product [Polarella glacialis]